MSLPLNPTHHLHPTHHPCCQSRNIAIDVLLMVLSTHCYRDSLCVSATVCDLHDCSQIKMPLETVRFFLYNLQDMVDWWFGLLSYACFYTPFNVKIPTPNCMKMHHLK